MAMTKEKRKAYVKTWREANKEKVLAHKKSYYEANREEVCAQQKSYYEANKEKIRAKQKVYYQANKEKIHAKQRDYTEANRDWFVAYKKAWYVVNKEKSLAYSKAWSRANKAKKTASNSKRRALKHKLVPVHLRDCPHEKQRIVQTYKLRNIISEATGVQHHVDHMWPLADGGPHWSGNLQVIPAEENISKSASVCEETKATIIKSLYTFESERSI